MQEADDVEKEPEPTIKNDGFPLSDADFLKYGEDKQSLFERIQADNENDAPGEPDEGTYTPQPVAGSKHPRPDDGDSNTMSKNAKVASTGPTGQQATQPSLTSSDKLQAALIASLQDYHDLAAPVPLSQQPEPTPRGVYQYGSLVLPEDFDESLERDAAGNSTGPFYRPAALRDEIGYQRANIGDPSLAPMTADAWRRAGEVAMAFYWTRETQESIDDFNAFLSFVQAPQELRAGATDMDDMLHFFELKARGW